MVKRFILLACCLLLIPVANSDNDPRLWLDKMSHAQRELNYQGTFTYEQASEIHAMRIAHAVIEGEEYERLEMLDGQEPPLLRRGHGPECIHLGDRLLRLYDGQQAPKPMSPAVAAYYDFSVAGTSRVAGRSAVELAIMPRDKHRFGHRLSLDKATGLLLRSVRYGLNNERLERFQYVTLELVEEWPADLISAFKKSGLEGRKLHHRQSSMMAGTATDYFWQPGWLPDGFALIPSEYDRRRNKMTFTDGLAVFSVFLEPASAGKKLASGHARRGVATAFSKTSLLADDYYRVTVVGEIPVATAEQISNALSVR